MSESGLYVALIFSDRNFKFIQCTIYNWLYTVDLVIFARFFFANFARRSNSRIQDSHENDYYNSTTKEK